MVAIGDIHGDLASFTAILQKIGLVDGKGRWTARDVTLVQTGDAIDRGAKSREVLDLLMELEKQAPKRRSRLIALLGNHEVMNMLGDLRYVTPAEYAAFADSKSEKRRMAEWKRLVKWKRERAKAWGMPEPVLGVEPDAKWLEKHPLGYFEHREAYGPRGKYGKWLRQHDAVAMVDGTLFLHAGISPELASPNFADINQRIHAELWAFDNFMEYLTGKGIILPFFELMETAEAVQMELQAHNEALAAKAGKAAAEGKSYEPTREEKQQVSTLAQFLEFPSWYSVNPEGPLWYRGYERWTEEEGPALAEAVLAKYGARAVVVGHSPVKGRRAIARFGGKVFLIDTGMLSSYYEGGRATALEIVGEKFTARYLDHSVVLHQAVPVRVGNPEPEAEPSEEPGGGLRARGPRQETTAASTGAGPADAPKTGWRGPSGEALPFRSVDEVIEFLRAARVVSRKAVGSGITKPKKLLLEKDGVQMHAIFRSHNTEKPESMLKDGRRIRNYRDSYLLEVAAFRMAQMLDLDGVPPVVKRRVDGEEGSVQLWIENAMTETQRQERKITPPDQQRWTWQMQRMRLFDLLIYNWDRHTDNILVDPQWNVWMIDHTRSFRREDDVPYVDQIILCERRFWERLQSLDEAAIRERLKDILNEPELRGLLRRREKLVRHLGGRIAEQGEARVLFSWPGQN